MKHTMTDKQFSSSNFYEVLGVSSNASQSEIKRMYQTLVLKVAKWPVVHQIFEWHFNKWSLNQYNARTSKNLHDWYHAFAFNHGYLNSDVCSTIQTSTMQQTWDVAAMKQKIVFISLTKRGRR